MVRDTEIEQKLTCNTEVERHVGRKAYRQIHIETYGQRQKPKRLKEIKTRRHKYINT
jgi:hypothetical protein